MDWIRDALTGLFLAMRAVLRWIGRMIVLIWQLCRASWVNVGHGLRPHSLASAAYLFMYVMLVLIGLALVLLGFNLADVDRWLDQNTYWWELLGTIVLKLFWGALLAGCLLILGLGLGERAYRLFRWFRPGKPVAAGGRTRAGAKDRIVGWGFIVTAIVVGYFAFLGVILPV